MNCELSRRIARRSVIIALCVALPGCATDHKHQPESLLSLGQEMAGVVLVSSMATHYRKSAGYWPTNANEITRAITELNSRFGAQTNELLQMIIPSASWFNHLKLTALTNGDLAVSYCSPMSHSKWVKFNVTQSGQTISSSQSGTLREPPDRLLHLLE